MLKIWLSLVVFGCTILILVESKCKDSSDCSGHGTCKNKSCECYEGWQGPQCQLCGGKIRLTSPTGLILDGVGNYSTDMKCTWLIDAPNSSITLHIEEFLTECGWDHLYVFDGDSTGSPLLAAFTGSIYKNNYSIRKIPEVVAHGGSALIHFHSDAYYNMSGFNISYRLNACPSNISPVDCSGNGVCSKGVCLCDEEWTGMACHLPKCPNDCWSNENRGRCEPEKGCICNDGWKGRDCGQFAALGFWETVIPQNFAPRGSASHGAVVWKDLMYVVGGESYGRGPMLHSYDFKANLWETPEIMKGSVSPRPRLAHSVVQYEDKLFMYGGFLDRQEPTSELWAFDINTTAWNLVIGDVEPCHGNFEFNFELCSPLKLAGHTSTVVRNPNNKTQDRMVVIFGYSPDLGYLNTIQEYYFDTGKWSNIVRTQGYPVKGGFGHSASWDEPTKKIYVYGGIVPTSKWTTELSKSLYAYEYDLHTWTKLVDAPSTRYLHSATFVSPGLMVVFGGNTYNDHEAKCFSSDALIYDVKCNNWNILNLTSELQSDLARYGHSAVLHNNSLYIYGGFDGQMLSDTLKYTPGSCSHFTIPSACLKSQVGIKCSWDQIKNKCVPIQEISLENGTVSICPEEISFPQKPDWKEMQKRCEKLQNCTGCLENECVWCPSNKVCAYDKCNDDQSEMIFTVEECPDDLKSGCKELYNCKVCQLDSSCMWGPTNGLCLSFFNKMKCPKSCAEFTSCLNCTQSECIWCQNEGRCVDKNAYTTNFPYGQCQDWTTVSDKCTEEDIPCKSHQTCRHCREDPACGWCDGESQTGLGECMVGGYSETKCPPARWHFTTCPTCQCNGHSHCHANMSTCANCSDFTMGSQCESCMPGAWGNPLNGGKCKNCECNGRATECNSEKCYCTTKGRVGDHCEKCDEFNRYNEDSISHECFYILLADYQFTFNLSRNAERHYTQINFKYSPVISDVNVIFNITCSKTAKMNVTARTSNSKKERLIYNGYSCNTVKFISIFKASDYPSGAENDTALTTFYVKVYDFQTPFWVKVSFAQYPWLNCKIFPYNDLCKL